VERHLNHWHDYDDDDDAAVLPAAAYPFRDVGKFLIGIYRRRRFVHPPVPRSILDGTAAIVLPTTATSSNQVIVAILLLKDDDGR